MEAATVPKKKSISKGKMKKTIRNVICRPDPLHWPSLSDDQAKRVETVLFKHKVDLPAFKKPHWKDIKSIPKDKRPKPPPLKKVDGLIFGISQTCEMIKNGQCSAVIVENEVNPQMIVQPLLEACVSSKVPVVCLKNLKITSMNYFGINTSCLGIKSGNLLDISKTICEIAKMKDPERPVKEDVQMEVVEEPKTLENSDTLTPLSNTSVYLLRADKRSRVFVPGGEVTSNTKKFIGQNFIEFSEKVMNKTNSKPYMKMILKRIANNPNRVKRK